MGFPGSPANQRIPHADTTKRRMRRTREVATEERDWRSGAADAETTRADHMCTRASCSPFNGITHSENNPVVPVGDVTIQ